MMNRTACLNVLKSHITNEIVVAAYSTASEWIEINDRVLNYFSFGAMGLASSHALGLALAHPNRRVVVLDGDGSLLMNLGTLVTIAAVAPKNLVHMVWHNGSYEANGGHQIPNKDVDFSGIARSAGIQKVHKISDMKNYEQQIGSILKEEGPVFAEMMIEQGPLGPRSYTEMYDPKRRKALRVALGADAA
jgi:thiamine pyrophosphate-dependent acetolactate synthase large subunit-like protein